MTSWVRGKCIGRGSFGTVSVAVNKVNGEVFAVKSVLVDRNAAPHRPIQIQCLENEIRILRSLTSPYIVKYLGDDVSHDSPKTSYRNIHLEYLPGGTVYDLATTLNAYVDEKTLRSHTYCIVSALGYLHSTNIVHCDVKGKNILVGLNSCSVKLADFGSAREVKNSDKCGVKIMPRGSPLWMAPEVVRGECQGPGSDVWSLGCTVIEMVTGKPAWEDFGADTLTRIGFSDELPRLPTSLSELGRDFLDKCLRREASERWSCDKLLKHPFLRSVSAAVTESSPRCVLDWVNTGFELEDEEGASDDNSEASARERIGKLASSSGENWESDGWVAVRGGEYSNWTIIRTATDTEGESPGANSVDKVSVSVKEKRDERVDEVSVSVKEKRDERVDEVSVSVKEKRDERVDSEFANIGGRPSCRDGWQKVGLAVDVDKFNILILCLSVCICCLRYVTLVAYGFCCYLFFAFI